MFLPLRVHSAFSRGRGGAALDELARAFARDRLPAGALTDIENLYGWPQWKRAAAGAGFSPLFGCEIEIGGRTFLFLVQNRDGYGNLMEILNRRRIREGDGTVGLATVWIPGTGEGRKPERKNVSSDAGRKNEPGGDGPPPEPLDVEALFSSLRAGPAAADLYVGVDFFNAAAARAAAEVHRLPLVWAGPLKYVRAPERLVLLHAFEKKTPFPPAWEKLRRTVRCFGPEQEALARKRFGAEIESAFLRTHEIAGKCRFDFRDVVPPLPADLFPFRLRDEVMSRLRRPGDLSWAERERALRELAVVERSGFGPYFLIVHDIVSFARKNGILHNLKGSGASSFLAWLLGISHVNPVAFDLYFERFLNSGRADPPDFDLDFDSRRRDRVLAYVLERYGRGRTGAAFVCALKSYGARSALYETARAFGLPPTEARALSRRAPYYETPEYMKKNAAPAGCLDIWKAAAELAGVHHEVSLHVGGVIFTPAPADRHLPLEHSAKGVLMSHYDRDAVEDLKLIKLDLLSVRGLAAISETKTRLGLGDLPPGDPAAYGLLKKAGTIGCFQVESPAMMNLLRRMKPGDIQDLTQALALIRPGPTECGMKESVLRVREEGGGTYRDPFLAGILPETGGVLLYEEQIMQIAERTAGMPPEEGDLLRRSLKRRGNGAAPDPLREKFFREARTRGYTGAEVEKLWGMMEKFSSYAFNKAHSASYAFMAYQAVYLKAHHPVPYLAAVLNAGGGYYRTAAYVEEAKRLGLAVRGPDVNRSEGGFSAEDGAIRVGFGSIKNLSLRTAGKIVEERTAGGPFASLDDFVARVPAGKAELFLLVKAGVFDGIEIRRTRQVLRYVQGIEGVEPPADIEPREKAKLLLESLGFSPGGDPLDLYEGVRPGLRIRDLRKRTGETVELVVRVVDARGKKVRGGIKYFYLFEDETGLLEGVGDRMCLAAGEPPVCCLRGEPRADGRGGIKIQNCEFLRSF
ncbi:MAG: DNA polymerase III subunit alpha [Acidobacteria bacterium]|nr:DNA polymerase III subunit alpha [Acidobacteriota bacterium]NMD10711.1 DNA polymerase III subunit alpha [Acidobacteriota bacterium]